MASAIAESHGGLGPSPCSAPAKTFIRGLCHSTSSITFSHPKETRLFPSDYPYTWSCHLDHTHPATATFSIRTLNRTNPTLSSCLHPFTLYLLSFCVDFSALMNRLPFCSIKHTNYSIQISNITTTPFCCREILGTMPCQAKTFLPLC